MTANFRPLLAGVALAAVGALLGALCGLVAFAPIAFDVWLHPTSLAALFVSPGDLAVFFAGIGAGCGAALVPALAFGMLRAVALWRVVAWLFAGTIGGTLAAAAASYLDAGPESLMTYPAAAGLSALAAALWLRRRTDRAHLADAERIVPPEP
jgi:MYXO-CTERM domain-containing protein